MNNLRHNKKGSGYLIVIAFASILLILFMIFGRVKSGHHQLQSKDVRRFVATNLAEAALNCIIAEMNANRAFNTHRYYSEKDGWTTPVKSRDSLLGDIKGMKLTGVKDGLYRGSTDSGEFKARFSLVYGARENSKTKTLKESEMYAVAEIVVKTFAGWGSKDVSCRKVSAFIERRFPANENLLYDGEILDLGGLGPFVNGRENQLRRGRLYGNHYITFNTGGGACQGSELYEVEKIETPGFIKALKDTRIEFANKTSMKLSKLNDSMKVSAFETHGGYLLDGAHGAHPVKLSRLPKERIKYTADRFKKTYGLTITSKTLPFGDYKNPYNKKDKFVDLNFNGYRTTKSSKRANSDSEADEGAFDDEAESADDSAAIPSTGSDDPEIIRKLKGDKIIIYSEVPLRIWGCPDKNITIYSLEDIVIAGDFNQNPLTSQLYKTEDFIDYKTSITNGKDFGNQIGNKVGAMIMSEKRVLIDVSRPSLFAKNEIKPYFLYLLAKNLHPSSQKVEKETKMALCPPDPTKRGPLVGLGPQIGADGEREPYYGTIAWLYKNPTLNGGGTYNSNMEDIINFFTPGTGAVFGIQDAHVRNEIIEDLKTYLRSGGDLIVDEQDKLFEKAWAQATLEEEKMPSKNAGAMGLMQSLFDEAKKDHKDGIFMPEITINAGIVSSTRRASKWKIGNSSDKVEDEIGNVAPFDYLKKPGYIIQRIYGTYTRLAVNEPDYFISGAQTGKNILRRRVWDSTNLSNANFKPLECPAVHNLLTFKDEQISAKEYDNFGKKE